MKWGLPEPLDIAKQPPVDRYCDLVLTGGVTDGIVYPWAVLELARQYRFKNIGGTSVGAMAAALTAAAEYGRRYGRFTGFNTVLRELPEKLARDIDGKGGKGRTRIFSLFQPAKSTKRLFDLFVRLLGSGGFSVERAATSNQGRKFDKHVSLSAMQPSRIPGSKWWSRLLALYRVYRGYALCGAFLGALGSLLAVLCGMHPAGALFVALPAIFACSLGMIALGLYGDLARVVKHDFGMCTGYHVAGVPEGEPSIIEWLHEGIQGAAGKALDQPLTFKDLWEAPGGPTIDTRLPSSRRKKVRSIDLRMITTNLTHARPYQLPLKAGDTRLFFKPSELRPFFPPAVIKFLIEHSDAEGPNGLRELPKERLPILVAARLSLSFPLLFCAVPLWAIDHERSVNGSPPEFGRCRFSDGGICANFPIHLFDAAVPEWPTFGIHLVPKAPLRRIVWLPRRHGDGGHDAWYRFDETKSLAGFLAGIAYSAKDWNDKTSMRMPGVRDRVVHLALDAGNSLNLKLSERDMRKLARWGQQAGRALVKKFMDTDRNCAGPAWNEHRWVRFHTFLAGLRERVELFRDATEQRRYGKPLAEQIDAARGPQPPLEGPDERALTDHQAEDLQALLAMLKDLESQFARAARPQPYKPAPKPSLHIRAPL